MSKPPMPALKKALLTDYKEPLPNPDDLVPASSVTNSIVEAINSAEAHLDLGVEGSGTALKMAAAAEAHTDVAASTGTVFENALRSGSIVEGNSSEPAPLNPVLAGALRTGPEPDAHVAPAEPSTFNVCLYHYVVDNGEYVSLFPAESPELMDEMLEQGMVREYSSAHQIKHNIKDKELEHRALALFHGEVSARAELTRRGFGRNW